MSFRGMHVENVQFGAREAHPGFVSNKDDEGPGCLTLENWTRAELNQSVTDEIRFRARIKLDSSFILEELYLGFLK